MEDKANLENLYTARLMLVPVTLRITDSLVNGTSEELEKLGIKTDKEWPTEDTMDILPKINKTLKKSKIPSGFEFWMIIKKDSMQVIGDIGFYGKPNPKGEVEIGFGLVEHERGKGYGAESLNAIMDWLDSQDTVKAVKADCLISNKPSARLLEKVGMKEIKRNDKLIYWKFIKHKNKMV